MVRIPSFLGIFVKSIYPFPIKSSDVKVSLSQISTLTNGSPFIENYYGFTFFHTGVFPDAGLVLNDYVPIEHFT